MTDYTANFTYVPGEDSKLWHDLDRTIPALPGMTIAALEEYRDGTRFAIFVQPVVSKRPRAVIDLTTGRLAARFGGKETTIWNVDYVRQHPLEGASFVLDHKGEPRPLKPAYMGPTYYLSYKVELGNKPINHPEYDGSIDGFPAAKKAREGGE